MVTTVGQTSDVGSYDLLHKAEILISLVEKAKRDDNSVLYMRLNQNVN